MFKASQLVLLLCLLNVISSAQTVSPITREGSYWVQTVSGACPIRTGGMLRVTAIGNITLRGDRTEKLTYVLRKRVRATRASEAESALRDLNVKARDRGAWTFLSITIPKRRTYSADLVITAPRGLAQARLETQGGSLTATDFDGEVIGETTGGRIDFDRLRSNANARTGGGEIHAGSIGGKLRAYSGGGGIRVNSAGQESWLDTAGGDIFVHEAAAPLHASTAGGSIRVDRAATEIFAKTAAGLIEVGQAGGLVTAETSGGAIQVNAARGVRCESSSGTIRLRNMQGPLRAATAHGSILAQLQAGQRIEDSILSTVLGDITVLLSSNIPVTIEARNESAGSKRRIVSDFREIRIRNADWESSDPVVAEGTLNGGGPVLRIVTSAGIIFLRRQK